MAKVKIKSELIITRFNSFKLNDCLLEAIAYAKWKEPTPIQDKAVTLMLEGKNVLALSGVRNGKTGAYLIPIIQQILQRKHNSNIQQTTSLIIAPIEDFAKEIFKETTKLTSFCSEIVKCLHLSTTMDIDKQRTFVQKAPDIIIGTPDRVLTYLSGKTLVLQDSLHTLVIDDSDLMISLRLAHNVSDILTHLPSSYQLFIVSRSLAKVVKNFKNLSYESLVVLKVRQQTVNSSKYCYIECDDENKFVYAFGLLSSGQLKGKTVIFVKSVDCIYQLQLYFVHLGIKSLVANKEISSCLAKFDCFVKSDENVLITTNEHFVSEVTQTHENRLSTVIPFTFIHFDFPSVHSFTNCVKLFEDLKNEGLFLAFVDPNELVLLKELEHTFSSDAGLNTTQFEQFIFKIEDFETLKAKSKEVYSAITETDISNARLKDMQNKFLNTTLTNNAAEECSTKQLLPVAESSKKSAENVDKCNTFVDSKGETVTLLPTIKTEPNECNVNETGISHSKNNDALLTETSKGPNAVVLSVKIEPVEAMDVDSNMMVGTVKQELIETEVGKSIKQRLGIKPDSAANDGMENNVNVTNHEVKLEPVETEPDESVEANSTGMFHTVKSENSKQNGSNNRKSVKERLGIKTESSENENKPNNKMEVNKIELNSEPVESNDFRNRKSVKERLCLKRVSSSNKDAKTNTESVVGSNPQLQRVEFKQDNSNNGKPIHERLGNRPKPTTNSAYPHDKTENAKISRTNSQQKSSDNVSSVKKSVHERLGPKPTKGKRSHNQSRSNAASFFHEQTIPANLNVAPNRQNFSKRQRPRYFDYDGMPEDSPDQANTSNFDFAGRPLKQRKTITNSGDNDQQFKEVIPMNSKYETDPVILARRQKQIDYGKNTRGYAEYLKAIPKDQRTGRDIFTPQKHIKYSRRSWDAQIKQWRKRLHDYDPQENEDEADDVDLSDLIPMMTD
ncbi:hypothetical protein JTE90_023194 [Oedothorax gibbosus]|uniref:RNA helicase n=1 Tax=Oedothorax gibbosus TaxID=931172 RepID=A0AAV6TRZ8_9ARAC|nr:hypothetical protein JTE90_023194 [Oedothorax gibbosus]